MSQAKELAIENGKLMAERDDLVTIIAFIVHKYFGKRLELDQKEIKEMGQKKFNLTADKKEVYISLD